MTFFIKKIDDYVPVGEDYPDMLPYGTHLVYVENGRRVTVHKVEPDHAAVLAAMLKHEDKVIKALERIVAIRPNDNLTDKQVQKIKEIAPNCFRLGTRESFADMVREIADYIASLCNEDTEF